ncbi:hypothetical protein FRC08_015653 [Ceratobasidium sp. 394]|nr:hypothetical protein FRC08_015653 [Ceratobasidium sp. 394]
MFKHFRDQRTDEAKSYWWNMAHPPERSVAQELAALDMASAVGSSGSVPGSSKRKHNTTASFAEQPSLKKLKPNGMPFAKTQLAREMKNFFDRMTRCDTVMHLCRQNLLRFDGRYYCAFNCSKMIERMRLKGWSAAKAASALGYLKRKVLRTIDGPWMGVDEDGKSIIYVLPKLFGKSDTTHLTDCLLRMASDVKLATVQADRCQRGKNYVWKEGFFVGCVNLAISWVPLFRKKTDPLPSRPIVNGGHSSVNKSAQAFSSIQEFLKATMEQSTLLNYVFSVLEFNSYRAHLEMKTVLKARLASAKTLSTWNPFVMMGASYIYSRRTPLHFDNKEAPEGWALLVVMGDCTTGYLAVPRLGIKFSYLPGTVVLLRGRILDHEVVGWGGEGNRICIAYFNHVSEWEFSGVQPPL